MRLMTWGKTAFRLIQARTILQAELCTALHKNAPVILCMAIFCPSADACGKPHLLHDLCLGPHCYFMVWLWHTFLHVHRSCNFIEFDPGEFARALSAYAQVKGRASCALKRNAPPHIWKAREEDISPIFLKHIQTCLQIYIEINLHFEASGFQRNGGHYFLTFAYICRPLPCSAPKHHFLSACAVLLQDIFLVRTAWSCDLCTKD
mmetsp:Transcript_106912/g.180515  ORF Transcript_106912/g.180515 Transcript_106912/m.180515 type:complete len:205 (-) Transcript_106912:226-840(-)